MKYVVVKDFADLQDNGYVYRAGDKYPRDGIKAVEERAKELASKDNKRGEVLIEKVKSSRPTKAELAAELTNPELYEAVQAKKAKEAEEVVKEEKKASRAINKKKEK